MSTPATNQQKALETINALVPEKVEQALGILDEVGVDMWLTFAEKKGPGQGDPVHEIIFGERDLGGGILALTRSGERIALVSGLDVAIPPATGVWDQVVPCGGDQPQKLIEIIERLKPRTIALNYSTRFPKADGLSHGKYLWLTDALQGTPYADRLCSAEDIIIRLRGRKTPGEIAGIRAAIAKTDEIFQAVRPYIRAGRTGREIYDFMLTEVDRQGLATSWSRDYCPIVTVGPVAPIGHTPPTDAVLQRGWTLQVDFGVQYLGFCGDFQRMWYLLDDNEIAPPPDVQRLFDTVRRGVDAIIENLGPGIPTWKPAEVALEVLTGAGYPPFQYSVGHALGRSVHDGTPGLSRRQPDAPEWLMEPGNVFTAEGLETLIEGCGWISLEDDVLVTESGHAVLTPQQREFWLV